MKQRSKKYNFYGMSKILLTGSSIFEQWERAAEAAPEHEVVNRALGGTTTPYWIENLARVLEEEAPDVLWFYCGSNDLCSDEVPSDVADNVIRCREIAQRHNPQMRFAYFSIIKAPQKEGRWELMDNIHTNIRDRLQPDDLFVDWNELFFVEGQPAKELFIEDGLHHHAEAYRQATALVRPIIKKWLNG
jgi:lysophospholipase L1-like esterase